MFGVFIVVCAQIRQDYEKQPADQELGGTHQDSSKAVASGGELARRYLLDLFDKLAAGFPSEKSLIEEIDTHTLIEEKLPKAPYPLQKLVSKVWVWWRSYACVDVFSLKAL